ncbi:MAG: HPr-rel-A system PqqD family peptide chaperone [Sedimenticola sp.]
MSSSSLYWRLSTGFEHLIWHCDSGAIVFHTGSGDTHHLNALATVIHNTLQSETLTRAGLEQKITDIIVREEGDDVSQSIDMFLTEMTRLGLIESVSQ